MRFVLAAGLLFTSLALAQNSTTGPLEVFADTDFTERSFGSTVRAHTEIPGIEGLKSFRVFDKESGKALDTSTSFTVTLAVASGTPKDLVAAQLEEIKEAVLAAHPEAISVKVHPVFVAEDAHQNVEPAEHVDATPRQPTSRLYQLLQIGVRKLKQRQYQFYAVGTAALLIKMNLSYQYWTSPTVLAQDWAFMKYALMLSLPQDAIWGFAPTFMQRLFMEWPKFVGAKKYIKPEIATWIAGTLNGIANGIAFREIVYRAQQAHPELVADGAKGVDSAFTTNFVGDYAISNGVGLITGPLIAAAPRTAHLKGWIGDRTQESMYQALGFENQIAGFVLASLPSSLVRYYGSVMNAVKVGLWAIAKALPSKRGRMLVVPTQLSPSARAEIYKRFGIDHSKAGFDPQFVVDAPNDQGKVEVQMADTMKLRSPLVACEQNLGGGIN